MRGKDQGVLWKLSRKQKENIWEKDNKNFFRKLRLIEEKKQIISINDERFRVNDVKK